MDDYNINTLSELTENTNHTQEFINVLSSNYYHKLINLPTRQRNHSLLSSSCSLIDNIYSDNACTSGVLKFLTRSEELCII